MQYSFTHAHSKHAPTCKQHTQKRTQVLWVEQLPHTHPHTASTDMLANSAAATDDTAGEEDPAQVQLQLHLKGLNIPRPSVTVRQVLS